MTELRSISTTTSPTSTACSSSSKFVADRLRHDGERSSYRQVAQQVVARDVGRGADRRSLDGDGDEGEVFAAAAVDDVADQDGFGLLFGSGVCICRKAAEQQAQQQNI